VRHWRRHELRRQIDSPTVTLLSGDSSGSLRELTALRAHEDLAVFELQPESAVQLATAWLRRAETTNDLQACALRTLAEAVPESLTELRAGWTARSNAERRAFLERQIERPQLRHVRAALLWLELTLPPLRASAPASDPIAELSLLCGFFPRALWPVPCVSPATVRGLSVLAQLSLRVPTLSSIAIVEDAVWQSAELELEESELDPLLQGMIGDDAAGAEERKPTVAASESLMRTHADARFACERARIESTAPPARRRELDERARSTALVLLLDLLQSEPVTRDLFTPGVQVLAGPGVPPITLDLGSASLRIAIDVDVDAVDAVNASSARRDRQRDVRLQTHGFELARFAANEVVEHSSHVVQAITLLACHRQPHLRG
jgi:hypothetical protein